jgi:flavin reductase (DIM6/NTAB) family NADH-FMN oxidoreductase RutF
MPRPFDEHVFRRALGVFATGVIVLTAGPPSGPHAMTANAVMSGSLRPPLVVVSVGRHARMHRKLGRVRGFGVRHRGVRPAATPSPIRRSSERIDSRGEAGPE